MTVAVRDIPVIESDQHHVLLQQVAGSKEETGPSSHDIGSSVEVNLMATIQGNPKNH